MTWHELLSLTPELKKKKKVFTVCVELVLKNGEADELQLKWGNVYDTINFTKTEWNFFLL